MEAVFGLLLVLLGVSYGASCDGRQDGAQCYGALGGSVFLRLMDSASGIYQYRWMKNSTTILIWKDNRFQSNLIESRSSFTPSDGTLRINNLSRNDSGEYTLTIRDSEGRVSEQRALQLFIQAPVSSVLLDSECLSQGEMRVSCSSEGGDSPQYRWTLGGRTLTDAELLSGNHETNNITLKQHVSGRLVCSVRNNVSEVSEDKDITTCGFIFINCTSNGTQILQWVFAATNTLCVKTTAAPTTVTHTPVGKKTVITVSVKPSNNITSSTQHVTISAGQWYIIMAGVLSAMVILLAIGVAVICANKKKKNNKAKEEADEQELTYADVRIMQQQGRQVHQRAEVEVEYGQVRFSERPRHTVEPAGDDCVYSQVRKNR